MNKIKTLLFLSVSLFIGLTFTSCNKYEDGPGFSLSSAKNRISRDWNLTNYSENGASQNIQGATQFVSLSKSGSYTQTLTIQTAWGPITGAESGNWEFSSDKKFVKLTKTGSSTTDSFRILELRKSQLKVKSTENNKEIIRTFEAK